MARETAAEEEELRKSRTKSTKSGSCRRQERLQIWAAAYLFGEEEARAGGKSIERFGSLIFDFLLHFLIDLLNFCLLLI